MTVSVSDLIGDMEELFSKLERFFKSEASVKRRGSAASISDNLLSVLTAFEAGDKSGSTHLV